MADSNVAVTAGSGTLIDTSLPSGGDHRQNIVIADPSTISGLAPVSATQGLYVATSGQPGTLVTGSITTATSIVVSSATGYGNGTITIRGTHAGIAVVFEVSDDGTNFYTTQVQRESDGAALTADTLATNGAVMYTIDLAGVSNFQVRATAYTSGTGNVRLNPSGTLYAPTVSIGNLVSGTGTNTIVAGTVSANTTLLAANFGRRGAAVFNDSSASLFVLLGAGTESATVFTVKIAPGGYYETPFGFTGRLSGHWTAAAGSARITEFTA